MAMERTVSNPAFLRAAQPVSRLKSHLYFFRRAFGIGEPDGGVAFGAGGDCGDKRIHFALPGDKSE